MDINSLKNALQGIENRKKATENKMDRAFDVVKSLYKEMLREMDDADLRLKYIISLYGVVFPRKGHTVDLKIHSKVFNIESRSYNKINDNSEFCDFSIDCESSPKCSNDRIELRDMSCIYDVERALEDLRRMKNYVAAVDSICESYLSEREEDCSKEEMTIELVLNPKD